jgi:dTDP-4-amino-4,6-dideoxygalactose transaminase
MYYLLLRDLDDRTAFIDRLKQAGIGAVFHYIPLHSSPAGMRYGRSAGELPVTDSVSERLVRMPLWIGLEEHLDRVLEAADAALAQAG